MQTARARFEGSVLQSLQELKSIEDQRLAEERARRDQAEADRIATRLAAERAERDAIEAQQRAEHAAKLAVEEVRLAAEREHRLRFEAEQAAELERQRLAFEEERARRELELRRAEVARKRPTWMVAVSLAAVALAGVLLYVAIDRVRASESADHQRQVALDDAAQARRQSDQAWKRVEQMERDLAALDRQISTAIDNLSKELTAAEMAAEKKRLQGLAAQRAELARQAEIARQNYERDQRVKPVTVDQSCLNNALCGKTK